MKRAYVVSEVLPTTRDAKGKIVTRSGVCTGVEYRGIEYGIMAENKESLRVLVEALNAIFSANLCKRAVWVKGTYFKKLPGRKPRSGRGSE